MSLANILECLEQAQRESPLHITRVVSSAMNFVLSWLHKCFLRCPEVSISFQTLCVVEETTLRMRGISCEKLRKKPAGRKSQQSFCGLMDYGVCDRSSSVHLLQWLAPSYCFNPNLIIRQLSGWLWVGLFPPPPPPPIGVLPRFYSWEMGLEFQKLPSPNCTSKNAASGNTPRRHWAFGPSLCVWRHIFDGKLPWDKDSSSCYSVEIVEISGHATRGLNAECFTSYHATCE